MEAKLENMKRYFFITDDVEQIERGAICYVIGRKGTGKTAICEYLTRRENQNRFSTKLSFKNYPFNELYSLRNEQYTYPNEYITFWKFLIYSEIAQLMMDNPKIEKSKRRLLEKIYKDDIKQSLATKISKWTSGEFNFSIFGFGGGITIDKILDDNTASWINRTKILEQFIIENLDDSYYFIAFDELDEDYKFKDIHDGKLSYSSLLTSLFKAVQDVKSVCINEGLRIMPIIFLRDDVFSLLQDPDRTKWGDFSFELDWTYDQLKSMIAYRLSRSIDAGGSLLPFDDVWVKLFSPEPLQLNQNSRISIYDYISGFTHQRPRDFIRFIRDCAGDCLKRKKPLITPEIVKRIEKKYSNYFRSELEDEIFGILPDTNTRTFGCHLYLSAVYFQL